MSAPWRVVALVAGREVRQRARSRAFVAITVVFAAALVVLAALPGLSASLLADAADEAVGGEPLRIGVVGTPVEELDGAVRTALRVATERDTELVEVADEAAAAAALETGELAFAYDPVGPRILAVAASGPFGSSVPAVVTDALGVAAVARDGAVSPDLLERVLRAEPIEVAVVATGSGVDPEGAGTRFTIAYVGAVLLYFFLVFSANLIVTGVVEEKGSRIVELLLPAVPARSLMGGKVLGLGLVGTVQAAVVILPAATVLALTRAGPPPGELVGAVAAVLIAFVLGFGLYAGVTAGLSSLVSRIEDSQVALLPLYAVLIMAFMVTFPVLGEPGSTLAVVATFVPFTAPFVVPARMVLVDVPAWQLLVSTVGVVVTGVLLTLLAARLYEGSILRGGARVRLREALRADRS